MTMMDYIDEQPELFRQALRNRKEHTELFCRIFAGENPDSLYLIASGTSGNAARAAALVMESVLNIPVYVHAPSSVNRIWGERPLLLLISQGGKSTNMLSAAKRLNQYLQISVTGSTEAKLNALCSHHILIPCKEENVGPKTKGYTMTILLLYLMALDAGYAKGSITEAEYRSYCSALETTAKQFEENIRRAKQWLKENEEELMGMQEIYLAGKGESEPIAREGALKMMETLMISASAFDFEEYLHGPSCSLRAETAGFYFLPFAKDTDYCRIEKMAAYHREISPCVFTISAEEPLPSEADGSETHRDRRDCRLLSSGQQLTRAFEEILPFQLISAVIPEKKGIDGLGMKCFKAIDQRLGVKDN